MESFTELLTDAFSETPGPSFASEDLDFENLNFDGTCEQDTAESVTPRRDGALLQEATGEAAVWFGDEAEDEMYAAEKVYREHVDDESGEEDFGGRGVSLKEDYTSSEGESDEEGSSSGDDEEEEDVEEPGELLVSAHCTDEVCENEDGVDAEGQPLAPQSAGNPQVSNKERGEAESGEELSYFGQTPEKGSETAMKSDASEEDEQESDTEKQKFSPEPASEGVTIELEGHTERGADRPTAAGLHFQCLPLQNLITEVEEGVEKMKEFSGEEHQEAGESFADYPSDFSSCEYTEDRARDQDSDGKAGASVAPSDCGPYSQQSRRPERHVRDVTWSHSTENQEDAEEAHPAGSVSLNAAGIQEKPVAVELVEGDGDETGESDSYSSSDYDDDDVNMRRSGSEATSGDWGQQDPEGRSQPEDSRLHGVSRTMFCSSDDFPVANSRVYPAEFLSWDFQELKQDGLLSEFVLTTEGTHQTETHTSGVNRRHTDDDDDDDDDDYYNSYSMVKREDVKSPSSRGSLDDSFFFDVGVETSGVAEQGNNENEDERNWEQEQERIKAFYDYYDDSDEETEREGRQTKVQFCADPLSQIIHYETDSDRDSLSSSTDREDDQSAADTSDELAEPGNTQHQKPECDPLTAQLQDSEPNVRNTHARARQHRCLSTMRLMLKMSLVLVAGLLMFWLATDEADWLHQISIF